MYSFKFCQVVPTTGINISDMLHGQNVGLSRSLIIAKLIDWSTKYGIYVDLINTNG